MFRMVMNLLDISRSEDGALIPRCAEFDVTALLNEVSSETVHRLEEKGQTLSLSIDPAVGAVVADRDLVCRVVENLLDNSHKYSPRNGRISIDVTTSTLDAGAGEPPVPAIELRVRDEGAGIPADYRTRVFEKYVRVEDRSVNEPRNSQGLGLVFCRTAVEAHGGRIWVEDSGARGSCFCLRLPRVTRVSERASGPDKPDTETPPPQRVALASAG